jgi:hypothetical protein
LQLRLTGKKHLKLIYNCTAIFLATAVADNAPFGVESLDDLQQLEIPPGEEEVILNFKETAVDRPILRKYTKEKDTIEEMMSKSAFLRIFRAMMKQAGYSCGTSIHAIRWYLGKKFDGESRSSKPLLWVCCFFSEVGVIRACRISRRGNPTFPAPNSS